MIISCNYVFKFWESRFQSCSLARFQWNFWFLNIHWVYFTYSSCSLYCSLKVSITFLCFSFFIYIFHYIYNFSFSLSDCFWLDFLLGFVSLFPLLIFQRFQVISKFIYSCLCPLHLIRMGCKFETVLYSFILVFSFVSLNQSDDTL